MANLNAYYEILCKGQKDYHGTHYGDLCALEKDQLLQIYNPKEKSNHMEEPILPGLPTEIIDLIFKQCGEVDAACLSLTSKRFHEIYAKHHGPYPTIDASCLQHSLQYDHIGDSEKFHRRCYFHARISSVKKLGRKELISSDLYYCNPCGKFHGPVVGRIDATSKHDVPAELPPGWVIRTRQGRYPEAVIRKSLVGRLKEWATS